jgi:adenylate cyclase
VCWLQRAATSPQENVRVRAAAKYLLSISIREKILSILLSVIIFAVLAGLTTLAAGRPITFSITNAIVVGSAVGLFEEFYLQTPRGKRIRNMHPLRALLLYTFVVVILYLIAFHVSHAIHGTLHDLPRDYRRLPVVIPLMIVFSAIGVSAMRVIHFIGAENLFHLIVGTYHRPVTAKKVLMFVDINNSTALSERLGALKTRSLVGKFLSDICEPITEHGGDIYSYTGDGLIASWDWRTVTRGNALLRSIDAMFAILWRERAEYERQFGLLPTFRVGVHGGEVVVSEQGDTRRSISIFGETINVAARMQDAARARAVSCVISAHVASMFTEDSHRLLPLGAEKIKGISLPIRIFEYRTDHRERSSGSYYVPAHGARR